MSREIVPIKKSSNLEINLENQNKFDLAWSFESKNLNSSIQVLEEEKFHLEYKLNLKLKYRQTITQELEIQLKQVNNLRTECDKLQDLCETEGKKKLILERDHQAFLGVLNQEESQLNKCEKDLENLREDYLIKLEKMTKNIQSKNNLLADIISFRVNKETTDEDEAEEKTRFYTEEIKQLEQEMFSLRKKIDELKKAEETWQKISSNQINYLLRLLENEKRINT